MARAVVLAGLVLLGVAAVAGAEPTPTVVDIRPFRDQLMVFLDSTNHIYVVKPHKQSPKQPTVKPRVWYGQAGKPLYEQIGVGYSLNGTSYSYPSWAPRISGVKPGYFQRRADGSFHKLCDKEDLVLTQLTGDKAKAVLDKSKLMTEYLMRRPHLLARDDSGVYYYVDRLSEHYGGRGFRVYVGRKGAMKQLPLTDVATDEAGEVFATKTGDLLLNHTNDTVTWSRGGKKSQLTYLNVDRNSVVIFTDLGIYQFIGTLCDNI